MMKNLILMLFMVGTLGLSAQTKFQKSAGTTSNDRNYHLAVSASGNLFATGYTESVAGHLEDAFLLKYNRFGEVQWAKTYGELGSENSWDVIITQNQDIVGVGYTSDISTYEAAIITRCDSAGNVIWSRGVGSTLGNVNFYRVIETSTGHLVATGLTSKYGQDDVILCKFTSTGTLLWSRVIKSQQDDEMMGLIETSQGQYLLAGLTNDVSGAGSSDFAVVKTNADGNVIWKKRYGGTGGDRLNSVIEINQAYYFVGWSPTGGIGNNDVILMKTDTAGALAWVTGYGTLQAERAFNLLYDSVQNSLIVAGYTDYSDSVTNNRNTFLMSTGLNGQMNWARSYGSTGTDGHWPTGLAMNDDEGYYVLGSSNTFGPGNYSLYLTKTDKDGNTACNQKNPQFSQQTVTGWSGAAFGTDSADILISQNITIAGLTWLTTTAPQCCSLFADAGPAAGVCPGDSVLIGTPGVPGYNYSWTYGVNVVGTTPTLYVSSAQAGNYVLMSLANGSVCTAGNSSATVSQLPAPPKPVITYVSAPGNYLSSSATTGNQWYYNGNPVPNATQQVYHAFMSGTYQVGVTNPEGCESLSDTLHHLAIGIAEQDAGIRIRIYPNPASDVINLISDVYIPDATIQCFDMNGNLVYEATQLDIPGGNSITLHVDQLTPGCYRVVVRNREITVHKALMIMP